MLYELASNVIFNIELDSYVVTTSWKQDCPVCLKRFKLVLKLTISDRAHVDYILEEKSIRSPKYVERTCSEACESVKAINPLAYEKGQG